MNSRGLRSVVLGLGVASCVAVTACGDDETSTNAGSGGGGGTGGGGSAGSPGLDGETITPGPFDISGSFAVQAVIKARAIIDLDTTQYFLVTFDQNGTHLDVATRTCDIALPSVPDVAEVVIPDKLRDVFRRDVVMTAGDFVSGTDGGAKYTPPAEVVVLGADLANPATDPLPTEADQTNAVDQDEDGHPGVTVEADVAAVCQGWQKLYVALRTTVTLDGTVLSSNEIVGDMEATLEQEILGMSDPCLSASDGIEVEVLPGSVFRARRIDGANDSTDLDANSDGAIDCEELTAGVETVFGD